MIAFQPIFLAAACAVALTACASAPTAPPASAAKAPQPAAAANGIQPVAARASGHGTANTGGTYPYGTIQKTNMSVTQQANAETTEEIVVIGPDGTVWLRSVRSDTAYQGDVH